MKTLLHLSLLLALTVTVCAAEAKKAPCCPADAPAAAPAAAFTDASIYNLDSTWTNHLNQPVQLSSLRGQPVALAFFFVHCEYACPILVHDLREIEAALPTPIRTNVQFVLITFDLERDTPEVLARYRSTLGLPENWTLLRGSSDQLQELAALLGVKYKKNQRGQFDHSNLITLLNPEGELVAQQIGLNRDPEPSALTLQKLFQ